MSRLSTKQRRARARRRRFIAWESMTIWQQIAAIGRSFVGLFILGDR